MSSVARGRSSTIVACPAVLDAFEGCKKRSVEAKELRIETDNEAARVEPHSGAYFNAVRYIRFRPNALCQI